MSTDVCAIHVIKSPKCLKEPRINADADATGKFKEEGVGR